MYRVFSGCWVLVASEGLYVLVSQKRRAQK
jgi:hypothetical protein